MHVVFFNFVVDQVPDVFFAFRLVEPKIGATEWWKALLITWFVRQHDQKLALHLQELCVAVEVLFCRFVFVTFKNYYLFRTKIWLSLVRNKEISYAKIMLTFNIHYNSVKIVMGIIIGRILIKEYILNKTGKEQHQNT